jgi:antitoxin component YwqK of YwqJK toxin-antitoxin module
MNYGGEKCHVSRASYFRIAFKEAKFWTVMDHYLETGRIKTFGHYSDDSFKVKEGLFVHYHPNGTIKTRTRYLKGLKMGADISYDTARNITDSGYYKNDIPVGTYFGLYQNDRPQKKGMLDTNGRGIGEEWQYYEDGQLESYGKRSDGYLKDSIWTYFHNNGIVSFREYFEKGKLLRKECFNEKGEDEHGDCQEEIMPVFNKYRGNFHTYLNEAIVFPPGFNVRGVVTVVAKFVIDLDGSINDVEIVKPVHPAFDKEVADLLKSSPKWTPGRDHNHKVKVYYTIPIAFSME